MAPVPYGGAGESSAAAPALNWGTVGPQRQTADGGYTYTALPQKPAALPEFGRVDTSWFADAAFLGDSLTAGFCVNEYNIDVGGALVCGYEGISPNTIVNRTTVSSPDRGEEVPLDVLTAAQPAKLYILIGTNALVQPGNDDSFLAYYGKMLDELRTALPNTAFYVQSVLPATQEKISDTLPGLAPDRLAVINAAIQQLCAERGCYYLDLNAEFADAAGCLMTDFAQPDGVHLTVSGYSRWVSYLCTHLPYSKKQSLPGRQHLLSERGYEKFCWRTFRNAQAIGSPKEPSMPNQNRTTQVHGPGAPRTPAAARATRTTTAAVNTTPGTAVPVPVVGHCHRLCGMVAAGIHLHRVEYRHEERQARRL